MPAKVIAGLVASWVKALTEPRLQALAEAILPPSPSQTQDVGADPSGHPENMPPAVLVDRATVALGRRLTVQQRLRAQRVIHYGMGAGLGLAYDVAARRWPAASLRRGTLAGLAIYAGTHGSLLPRRLLAKLKDLARSAWLPPHHHPAMVGAQPADPSRGRRPLLRHGALRPRPQKLGA